MVATIALIELIGYVVLLLWGMRMIQSGITRAFGSNLRRVLGRTLRNRFAAMGAGLVVTASLQDAMDNAGWTGHPGMATIGTPAAERHPHPR